MSHVHGPLGAICICPPYRWRLAVAATAEKGIFLPAANGLPQAYKLLFIFFKKLITGVHFKVRSGLRE